LTFDILTLYTVIYSTGRTDNWVISGLLSVRIGIAERRCHLGIHIPHYPHPNPDPNPNPNPVPNPKPNPNPKSYPNLKSFNE